jgi:hypothetical protein
MKKKLTLTIFALLLFVAQGFAQFFPKVEKPTSPEMSMLALQGSHDEDGKPGKIENMNFTGWAPAVMNAEGKVVPFRNFDAGADFTNIYYAENLPAGEYKLIGFYHVYTDVDKLREYQKKFPNFTPRFTPYEDNPYHVKQLFNVKDPVVVMLEPNKVMTFGSYLIKYAWTEGMGGTTTDRWKAIENKTSVISDPQDATVLRYMKTWATPAWKKWNEKNVIGQQ